MNFHLSGQRIRQKSCTEYLGVLLDEHLLSKDDVNTLKQKSNRAHHILAKLRHHLTCDILKTIYYSLFWHTFTLCMSGLGTKRQWNTSHGAKS